MQCRYTRASLVQITRPLFTFCGKVVEHSHATLTSTSSTATSPVARTHSTPCAAQSSSLPSRAPCRLRAHCTPTSRSLPRNWWAALRMVRSPLRRDFRRAHTARSSAADHLHRNPTSSPAPPPPRLRCPRSRSHAPSSHQCPPPSPQRARFAHPSPSSRAL
jgi:hypothetical protein